MSKTFPIHSHTLYELRKKGIACPDSVPWDFVAPHEAMCLMNHDQTVQRLAERGGLGLSELWCVVEGKRFRERDTSKTEKDYVAWLNEKLLSFQKRES